MTEHSGKEMPCKPDDTVIVRLRCNSIVVGKARKFIWNWYNAIYHSDVIEYKVVG